MTTLNIRTGSASANSVDPDLTAPWEQPDQGLHFCYFTSNFFSKLCCIFIYILHNCADF